MALPPLVLKIVADSSGVKAGVAQTQAQVSGLKGSILKNASLIKTGLAVGVVAGLAAATKAASGLEESLNKATVIFGRSSAEVVKWSEDAADSMGLSQQAALEYAATFGNILKVSGLTEDAAAGMSQKLVALASDLASFNNIGTDEALEKIRAGIVGEAEPLRTVGVLLSEARVEAEAYASGIATVGSELTDQQKVQARYNLILKDTKSAQGDFGRTSDSLANRQRSLGATLTDTAAVIGKELMPVVSDLTGLLKEAAPALGIFAKALHYGLLPLTGSIESLKIGTESLSQRFDVSADTVERVKEEISGFDQALHYLADPLGGTEDILQEFSAVWLPLRERMRAAGVSTEEINRIFEKHVGIIDANRRSIGAFSAAVTQDTAYLEGWAGRTRQAAIEQDELAGETREATRALKAQKAALDDLAGGTLGVVSALRDAREAEAEVDKLRRRGKLGTEAGTEAILAATEAQLTLIGRLREYRTELEDGDLTQRQVEQRLRDIAAQMGITRAEFRKAFPNLKKVADELYRINELPRSFEFTATVAWQEVVLPARTAAGRFTPGMLAEGGPAIAGRPYIVGEDGPELFVPASSGTVIPNGGTVGEVGGVTVNVHGDIYDADGFEERVARAARRLALKGAEI